MAQFKRKSTGAVHTANASFTWTISGIALVACGGGGGGGGGAPSSIAVSYYDITIYDGPISGALLYSDVNNNDIIDDDDIFLGETDAHGVVRISETAGRTALIANLDGAIDTDNPDEILSEIIWRAPAGSLVVSPLTELLVVAGEDTDLLLANLGLEESDVKTINPFDTNSATPQDEGKTENLIHAARQVGRLIKDDGDNFIQKLKAELDELPTEFTINKSHIDLDEGSYGEQVLARLSIKDDGLGSHRFELSESDIFNLVGNELRLKPNTILDYENSLSHEAKISLYATSEGRSLDDVTTKALDDVTFTIKVNNAPISISLSQTSDSLAEGIYEDGQKISDITLSGDAASDSLSFTTDDDRFEVRGDKDAGYGLWLKAGEALDFETDGNELTVSVTSAGDGTDSDDITLTITDRPVTFALADEESIEEGYYINGYKISDITLSGDTASDSLSFTTNDDRFEVRGDKDAGYALFLKEGIAFDYEADSRPITITVTSAGDGTDSDDITLTITDRPVMIGLEDVEKALDEGLYETGSFLTRILLEGDESRASDFALSLSNDYLFEVRKINADEYELWLKDGIELDYEMTNGDLNQDRFHNVEITSSDGGFANFNLKVVNEPEASILTQVEVPLDDHRIDWLFTQTSWSPILGQGVEIDYSFINTTTSLLEGTTLADGELQDASQEFKDAVAHSFSLFEQVSLLRFQEVDDNEAGSGFIRIGMTSTSGGSGAHAYYPYSQTHDDAGNMWFFHDYNQFNDTANLYDGSYFKAAITHEMGHALGLGHTQEHHVGRDVRLLGADDNNTTHTIMAYPEAWNDKVGSGANNVTDKPTTLMINDILALHYLYGANYEWATGDDLYHFGGRASADDVLHETIWDAGGIDEFSWQGQSQIARINLNQGSLSYFGAISSLDSPFLTDGHFGEGTGIVGIAYNTIIENATGGEGDDVLIANDVANQLDGGAGADAASYEASDEAVTVDLSDESAERGGDAAGDRLTNIENLIGSDFDDTLIGDEGDNILEGRQGADSLDGRAGFDTASYKASDEGVTVNLSSADRQQGGHAAGDRLTNIENLTGSDFDDTLVGDDGDNIIEGGSGADSLDGGSGNDELYSGSGNDTLYGGDDNDRLFGQGGVNILDGGRGHDDIFADSGRAIMTGGDDSDVFAISHIASDIENACVITDFSLDDFDWLDFSAYIDALWYDQSRSVNTGEASNDSSQNDTVLYGKADGSEVVIVLEDFSDTDFFMAISRASIEIHAFEAEIV